MERRTGEERGAMAVDKSTENVNATTDMVSRQ